MEPDGPIYSIYDEILSLTKKYKNVGNVDPWGGKGLTNIALKCSAVPVEHHSSAKLPLQTHEARFLNYQYVLLISVM